MTPQPPAEGGFTAPTGQTLPAEASSPVPSRSRKVPVIDDDYLAALIPGWYPGIGSAEYSRCIGGFASLTEDAEAALIKQLMAARSGRVALPGDSVTLTADLQNLVTVGEQAEMRLLRANLKLVVGIAKQYAAYEVPLIDLVRAGNAGLLRAAEASAQCAGYHRFPAFSERWIRQAIENRLGT